MSKVMPVRRKGFDWFVLLGLFGFLGAYMIGCQATKQTKSSRLHPLESSYVHLARNAQQKGLKGKEQRAWRDLLRSFPDSRYRVVAMKRLRVLSRRDEVIKSAPEPKMAKASPAPRKVALQTKKPTMKVATKRVVRTFPKKSESTATLPQPPVNPTILGVILPESGRGAVLGRHIRRAVLLASRAYPQIRVVMVDSESQPDAAERAVDTLVERHKAIAILGPPLRQSAVAAAKRAQARGVPFISITTMPGLTGIGEYVFRNNLTLSDIGTIMAQYAYRSLGLRKFGVFSPTSRFGREQAKAFQREIERLGGKIVKRVSFSPRSRNLRPPLRKLLGKRYINRSKLRVSRSQMRKMKAFMRRRLRKKIRHMLRPLPPFEGLFVPEDARTGSQVAAYLTLLNMPLRHPRSRSRTKVLHDGYKGYKKIVLLGNHSWYHKDLFKAGKSYSKGATFCARFDRRGKSGKQFIRSYRRRFGKKPLHIDAYTYDAMRVLLQVASSGDARTRMAFRSALANVRYVGGPTGPFRFNEQGHAVGPARCFITGYGSFYGKTTLATVPTKRRDASSN